MLSSAERKESYMKLGSTIWLEAGAVLAQRRLALHNGYASTQIIMCQHMGGIER